MRGRGRTYQRTIQPTSVSIQLMLPLSYLHELCFTISLHSLHERYGVVWCLRATVVWHKTHAFSHSEGNCGFSWILGPGRNGLWMPADTLVLCAYGCFLISLGKSPINSVFGFCRKLLVHAIPEPGLPGELKCIQVCCMQSKNTFNFCRTFF